MIKYNEFLEIRKLIENRKFDVALIKLEDLYKLNPGNRFIEFEIAKIKSKNDKTIDEAKRILINLLEQPKASYAMLELGKIEYEQGNMDKARSYFKKIIATTNEPMAYIELAQVEFLTRNFTSARNILETLLQINSEMSSLAQTELGKIERKLGNIDKSFFYLNSALNNTNSQDYEKIRAKLELAKLEIDLGDYDKAISLLNELLDTKLREAALLELIYLEIKQKKYELAYDNFQQLKKCPDYVQKKHFNQMEFFLKHKLGMLKEKDYTNEYFYQQLFCYNEKETLKHIKLHFDKSENKIVHSIYSESINIDKLYNFVKKQIIDMKPHSNDINDKYIIKCNKIIGKTIENKLTDTLKVVTLLNTKNILTMYPIPAIDNKVNLENDIVKTKSLKRESQIDKFNRRYAKK